MPWRTINLPSHEDTFREDYWEMIKPLFEEQIERERKYAVSDFKRMHVYYRKKMYRKIRVQRIKI